MSEPVSTRTYEVEYTSQDPSYGTRSGASRTRITIPETWKVTFGPIVGAGKAIGMGNTLRVWESDTKQRLLISNVLSFRDISIPIEVAAARPFGRPTWHLDNGSWTGSHADKVERRWVSIDEISDLPLSPGDLDRVPEEIEDDPGQLGVASWREPRRTARSPF